MQMAATMPVQRPHTAARRHGYESQRARPRALACWAGARARGVALALRGFANAPLMPYQGVMLSTARRRFYDPQKKPLTIPAAEGRLAGPTRKRDRLPPGLRSTGFNGNGPTNLD